MSAPQRYISFPSDFAVAAHVMERSRVPDARNAAPKPRPKGSASGSGASRTSSGNTSKSGKRRLAKPAAPSAKEREVRIAPPLLKKLSYTYQALPSVGSGSRLVVGSLENSAYRFVP